MVLSNFWVIAIFIASLLAATSHGDLIRRVPPSDKMMSEEIGFLERVFKVEKAIILTLIS